MGGLECLRKGGVWGRRGGREEWRVEGGGGGEKSGKYLIFETPKINSDNLQVLVTWRRALPVV